MKARHEVFIVYQNLLLADSIMCFLSQSQQYLASGRHKLNQLDLRQDHMLLPDALTRAAITIFEVNQPSKELSADLSALAKLCPRTKIVLISDLGTDSIAHLLTTNVVRSFLLKSCTDKTLFLQALDNITNERNFYCSAVTKKVLQEYQVEVQSKISSPLTEREQEILTFLAMELSTSQIAARLYLSSSTVKTHRRNIMKKLRVSNVLALLRKSVELGLLSQRDMSICNKCCQSAQPGLVKAFAS